MIPIQINKVLLYLFTFVVVFFALRCVGFVAELVLIYVTVYVTDYFLTWIKDPLKIRPLLSDLRGKSVLITGCDSGFGYETARRLASIGVTVFAGCLFPEGPGAQGLNTACSENLHILPLDVTKDEQVNAALQYVKTELGGKDLWAVVNNAGVNTCGDFEIVSLKNMKHLMEVNALGPARISKAFLPLIRKAKGRIVIVGSMGGRGTSPALIPYCMSKHAALSLTDGLRRQMMPFGVSVHSIEPWTYSTNFTDVKFAQSSLKENWASTTAEVKAAYGDEAYLQSELEGIETASNSYHPASKIYEVVNAIIHAALGENPQIRYEVGTVWSIKPLMYLPDKWADYVYYKSLPSSADGDEQRKTSGKEE